MNNSRWHHWPLIGLGCCMAIGCSSTGLSSTGSAADRSARMNNMQAAEAHAGQLAVEPIRSRPGRIELPYVHYRHPHGRRPTVIFLGGGPGISNLGFSPPKEWLHDFDVLVLEYRGVGRSSITLEAPPFAQGLRKLSGRLSSDAAQVMKPDFAAGFSALRDRGVVFDEFSVDALADDLERLRLTLRLPQVYLVAHSFGTRVALSYQTRYRSSVNASLLFAMNLPGGFIWHPDQTQAVLRRYQTHLSHTDPAFGSAFRKVIETPATRPTRYGPFRINDAKALFVSFFLSFNRRTRDHAYQALVSADQGSAWRWWLMDKSYDWFIRFGFNWADFFLKAYTTDCDRQSIHRADDMGAHALFQSPSSVLFAGMDGYEASGGKCQPAMWTPDLRHTLAINGEFDTTTPVERRPATLSNDHYIVVPGAGHADVLYADQARTAAWMRDFFLRPANRQPPPQASGF